jgi:FemAB-related protein (PEP-CTERM system-associated)
MSGNAAYVVSSEVGQAEWDAFVASHPEATGYHLWAWRRVFERAFGHETCYLAARRDGALVGVLPLVAFRSWFFGRFMVSLPFVNYGGVLAAMPNDQVRSDVPTAVGVGSRKLGVDAGLETRAITDALVDAATRAARERGCKHLELRHTSRQLPDLPLKQHKVAMNLALETDVTKAWEQLDRKVRNQVRKAQKSELVSVVGGRGLLDEFYGIFAVNMRDLGTPVYGRAFFDRVLEEFPETARVHVVRKGDVPVASGITYAHRDTIEVPWASSLRQYRALCPNNLLYWSIIEHAVTSGFRTLDFGRSTPNEGTYEFKRQWGAVPSPLFWEYALVSADSMPDHSPANPKFKSAIELWKRLPVPVATAIGPHIVRSIP